MRVLVIGATGYIGSRLVSDLISAGHTVVAGARNVGALEAYPWAGQVEHREIDVLDPVSTATAITPDLEAIVYLVHGMASDDFADADHRAAEHVRSAVDAVATSRIVYVSGIIPDVAERELSDHLRSRLDVERVLSASSATTITLRAAMVMGGGSTSFELMRQLADRLPITVIPDWMDHLVEPIAVTDLTHAIVGALRVDAPTSYFEVGGGEPVRYPALIERYTEVAGISRPQLPVGFLPEPLVARLAAWIADVPSPTVRALMESLQEDMVAGDRRWILELAERGFTPMPNDEALARSLRGPEGASGDAMARQPYDPEWVGE